MISHYKEHAKACAYATRDVDMALLYSSFLSLLPPSGRLPNASPEFASLASQHAGLMVYVLDFLAFNEHAIMGEKAKHLLLGCHESGMIMPQGTEHQTSAEFLQWHEKKVFKRAGKAWRDTHTSLNDKNWAHE